MGDSDEERDGLSDPGIDLTGFLFGNIDELGQLENDVLDNESKRHLASLSRLGLSSILKEVIDVEHVNVKSESDSEEDREQEPHPQQDAPESNRSESNCMLNLKVHRNY
jgi:transcription initiation factor TFIID subunit 1